MTAFITFRFQNRGQIPYLLYYNVLPSLEVGGTGASAVVGDVVDAGLTTAPSGVGNRVSAISLQSSKALQELVARRTVLAVMSHVVQVNCLFLSTLFLSASLMSVPFLSATEFSVADYDSTPCGVVRRRRCRGWRWRECSN